MLSIEKCKDVLNRGENKYSSEQAKIIRDYLFGFTLIVDELKSKANESS
jgi:hypothetical protein